MTPERDTCTMPRCIYGAAPHPFCQDRDGRDLTLASLAALERGVAISKGAAMALEGNRVATGIIQRRTS